MSMVVEDKFFIPGRGTVIVSTIRDRAVDDPVSCNTKVIIAKKVVKICGIERAAYSDKIGIVLGTNIQPDDITVGDTFQFVYIPKNTPSKKSVDEVVSYVREIMEHRECGETWWSDERGEIHRTNSDNRFEIIQLLIDELERISS